jgi:hypothetical protein
MSGYRDLERQLRESVRRRAAARAFPPRRWRSHRMALALAPLALVGGVATAATQLGHGTGNEENARSLAFRAVRDTRNAPPAVRPSPVSRRSLAMRPRARSSPRCRSSLRRRSVPCRATSSRSHAAKRGARPSGAPSG